MKHGTDLLLELLQKHLLGLRDVLAFASNANTQRMVSAQRHLNLGSMFGSNLGTNAVLGGGTSKNIFIQLAVTLLFNRDRKDLNQRKGVSWSGRKTSLKAHLGNVRELGDKVGQRGVIARRWFQSGEQLGVRRHELRRISISH